MPCKIYCKFNPKNSNLMSYKSTHNRCGKCGKCQIFGTFATPNTKNTSYQIWYMCQNYTDRNGKPKYCFLFDFLSPLTSGIDFFSLLTSDPTPSHIRPSSSLNRERTKWHTPHLQTISSKARWPLSQAEIGGYWV